MRKSLICSFVLLLAFTTTALSSKQASVIPMDRTGLKPIKCKQVERDASKSHSSKMLRHPTSASKSLNWAGYTALTNLKNPESRSVEVVSGTWKVPHLKATPNHAFSAIWVGIDGFASNSPTVEQIGTESDWIHGAQENFAWFELFPGPSFELVGFPVNPGDLMGGEVAYVGDNKFLLYIMNFTEGVFTVVPAKVPGAKRNSAQWIVEAPSGKHGILPLANFNEIPFLQCIAKIDGDVGAITDDDWKHEAIIMVSQADPTLVKAAPSKTQKEGESFAVCFESEGP
jgi:hypothetical protein